MKITEKAVDISVQSRIYTGTHIPDVFISSITTQKDTKRVIIIQPEN